MLFTFIKWWSYKNKEVRNSKKQGKLKETIKDLVEQLLDDPEIERRNRILIEHGKIAPTKEEERFMKALEAFKGEESSKEQQKKPSGVERTLSWLFGDYHPENNIALVCGSCKFHNGFASHKEFLANGFSFVCYHCKKLNRRANMKSTPSQTKEVPSTTTSSSSSSSSPNNNNDDKIKTETYSIDNGIVKLEDENDDNKAKEIEQDDKDEIETKKDK